MDEATRLRIVARMHSMQAEAQDTINDLTPPSPLPVLPWWQALPLPAYLAIAAPNKVIVFRHTDGSPIVPAPRTTAITYKLDLFAINLPLGLLLITDPAGSLRWWVAAGDVQPA